MLLMVALWMGTLFIWVLASDGEAVSGWPVQLTLTCELILFYLFFWSHQGQTLGMAAWRIKLVGNDGDAPGIRRIILRIVCAPLSIFSVGLGYLWIYIDADKRTWHDRLSDTMVVHIPK